MSDFSESTGERTPETQNEAADPAQHIHGAPRAVQDHQSAEINIVTTSCGDLPGPDRQDQPTVIITIPEPSDPSGVTSDDKEPFQASETDSDLEQAQVEVTRNIQKLNSLSEPNKVAAAEVITETAALNRLITKINELLSSGQPVPPGLAVSVTVRVELVQEAVKQATKHADAELKGILQQVLEGTQKVGRKLLIMFLHRFPVKEWTLGGEVSALLVKGTISVTFSGERSTLERDPGHSPG
jgi:hypothetical protein